MIDETFLRMSKDQQSYICSIAGLTLKVLPGVFSPKYFIEGVHYAGKLMEIAPKGSSFLEVGTGTGLIAMLLYRHGIKVTVTDVNPLATKNCKENFTKYSMDIRIYTGDLFDPVPDGKKFDFIFWNHPFETTDHDGDLLKMAGYDPGYVGLDKYMRDAKGRLAENGQLLLGTSNFADQAKIANLAKENGWEVEILNRWNAPFVAGSEKEIEYLIVQLK